MNLKAINNVHFIGIGGIGMSALARYFKFLGKNVSGYDRNSTKLTKELESEGMKVYYEENLSLIPEVISQNPTSEENLIVFTPAIPDNHIEIQHFKNQSVRLFKRAEILGEISKTYKTIGVAGTHGKTTTTSLLTFICKTAKLNFMSFVGGINENFNSNLVVQGDPEFVIMEADEYDRSFLQLRPAKAIITSMDADHLDIYKDASSMSDSFKEFAELIHEKSALLIQEKLKNEMPKGATTYSLSNTANCYSDNIKFNSGKFEFDYKSSEISLEGLKLSLPGYHNLENATAAIAMSLKLGAKANYIKEALDQYKGVKRRFEYLIDRENLIYIDDYAHHPEEINAVVSSLRKMYPGKKITGIFQPHLFSRTRDLSEGFAESLGHLDELILLEIYPAREKPIPGITSQWLLNQVNLETKVLCQKDQLIEELKNHQPEIIITLGAGDIDQLVEPIKNLYDR